MVTMYGDTSIDAAYVICLTTCASSGRVGSLMAMGHSVWCALLRPIAVIPFPIVIVVCPKVAHGRRLRLGGLVVRVPNCEFINSLLLPVGSDNDIVSVDTLRHAHRNRMLQSELGGHE